MHSELAGSHRGPTPVQPAAINGSGRGATAGRLAHDDAKLRSWCAGIASLCSIPWRREFGTIAGPGCVLGINGGACGASLDRATLQRGLKKSVS